MEELVARLRREQAVHALIPLFFVSGATALVYQTLWGRQLHLVFGTSTFAISTVLSAFMAGLALGGLAMARHADRIERPLAAYGALEVGIGLYALVFPTLIGWLEPVYLAAARGWSLSPVAFAAVQFVLVGGALLAPTAAMGATLPLLARFATDRLGAAGDRVGLLYAVNTGGAVFGTWFAGFVALPSMGLWSTTVLAAVANLVLGGAAIGLSAWARAVGSGEADEDELADDEEVAVEPAVAAAVASAGLAGFASLVYEVAWFRLLGLMLGASVYAFSVMLLAFLVGIAIGGRLGGPLADRRLAAGGVGAVLVTLAWVELGVAVAAWLTMHLFGELPFWYVWLFDSVDAEARPGIVWVLSTLLSGLVMAPAALLMGAAFPLSVRAALGSTRQVGDVVGRVYASNTVGGLFGAALAGFVFLPRLGLRATIWLAMAVNLAAAAAAWGGVRTPRRQAGRRWLGAAAALGVANLVVPPAWHPLILTAGMYKYVTQFEDHSRAGILDYAVTQYELLYFREGLSSVVTVARNLDTSNIWLANNGKVDASTTADMPTQVMVSLLPMQFVEDPSRVLVIGLASGITAGAVTLIDEVDELHVVELEPAIREAAAFFEAQNHGVLTDPRTRLFLNDGRNHVLLSEPGTYDVIVSEPSNPWLTGVSNLFTLEFLRMGKTRLRPGGVWSQWVQMYGMDETDLRSLLATFTEVYPHVLMYAAAEDADLVLLGSDRPLDPGLDHAARLFRWEGVAAELHGVELHTPIDLISTLVMDRDDIRRITGAVALNTDDNMRIEYRAPLNLHRDTQRENVALLYRNARVRSDAVGGDPWALRELARSYREREDIDRSVDALVEAALRLEPGSDEREAWLREALEWFIEAHKRHDEVIDADRRRDFEAAFMEDHVAPMVARETERQAAPTP